MKLNGAKQLLDGAMQVICHSDASAYPAGIIGKNLKGAHGGTGVGVDKK
jgi:hypothetical protein